MVQILEKSKMRRKVFSKTQRPRKTRTIGATQEKTIRVERGRITIPKITISFSESLRQRSVSPY